MQLCAAPPLTRPRSSPRRLEERGLIRSPVRLRVALGHPVVTSSLGARALTVTPAAGLPAQASWSRPHARRVITQVAGVDMLQLTGESRYACAATPRGSPASTPVRASVPIEMVPSDPTLWVRSPRDRSSFLDPILPWVISIGGRRYAVSHAVGWRCRLVHAANPEGCGRRSAASPARRSQTPPNKRRTRWSSACSSRCSSSSFSHGGF